MGERRRVLVGLALAMAMGLVVYFKLWAMDYTISATEVDLIRQQFDLASREAMDESAEWRLKYDQQADQASKCVQQLNEVKQSFRAGDSAQANKELEILKKERAGLLEQLKSVKKELASAKVKCKLQ